MTFLKPVKYKKSDSYKFVKQRQILLTPQIVLTIWNNLDKEQEEQLGYKMWDDNHFFKNKYKKAQTTNIPLIEG